MSNGLVLEDRVKIIGDDDGDASDRALHTFQPQRLPGTAGTPATRLWSWAARPGRPRDGWWQGGGRSRPIAA